MKTLLTAIVVASGAILPATVATAAPASQLSGFAAKTYGGFAPGRKFTFKVTELVSAKQKVGGQPQKCPVPNGIPSFKKGKPVKFTIGGKGQLTGKGFSLKYRADGITANVYANTPKKGATQADAGEVFKDSTGKPTGVALSFFKVDVDKKNPFNSTTYMVTYVLE